MNVIFPYIVGKFIIPTDFPIFQRGRYTTKQFWLRCFVFFLGSVLCWSGRFVIYTSFKSGPPYIFIMFYYINRSIINMCNKHISKKEDEWNPLLAGSRSPGCAG